MKQMKTKLIFLFAGILLLTALLAVLVLNKSEREVLSDAPVASGQSTVVIRASAEKDTNVYVPVEPVSIYPDSMSKFYNINLTQIANEGSLIYQYEMSECILYKRDLLTGNVKQRDLSKYLRLEENIFDPFYSLLLNDVNSSNLLLVLRSESSGQLFFIYIDPQLRVIKLKRKLFDYEVKVKFKSFFVNGPTDAGDRLPHHFYKQYGDTLMCQSSSSIVFSQYRDTIVCTDSSNSMDYTTLDVKSNRVFSLSQVKRNWEDNSELYHNVLKFEGRVIYEFKSSSTFYLCSQGDKVYLSTRTRLGRDGQNIIVIDLKTGQVNKYQFKRYGVVYPVKSGVVVLADYSVDYYKI